MTEIEPLSHFKGAVEDTAAIDSATDAAERASDEELRPGWRRYFVAWFSCIGLMMVLAMRSEMGIAIIQMTRKVKRRQTVLLGGNSTNGTTAYRAQLVQEVAWNHIDVGLVEAAFFIGYALFSVPGGFLASRMAAPSKLLGAAVLTTCSFNLLVPVLAKLQPAGLALIAAMAARATQGAAEGCLYPSMHATWRFWAPAMERSRLVTISFFGVALGPIIGLPLAGALTQRLGWPANFYLYGAAGCVWAITWLLLVPDQPGKDRLISKAELRYIQATSSPPTAELRIPLREIFTSRAVWAIVLANMGRNWSFQFSTIGLPAYYAKAFKLNSESVGLHLMAPFILMAAFTPVGGIIADYLRRRLLSTTATRKLMNTVGFGTMAGCMLIIGFSHSPYLSTVLLTIGFGFTGLGMSGYGVNHLDIAPRYAGFLMGVSNGIGTVSGVVSPILASRVTQGGTVEEWRTVFLVATTVHTVTVLSYFALASGEAQPWASGNESARLLNGASKPADAGDKEDGTKQSG